MESPVVKSPEVLVVSSGWRGRLQRLLPILVGIGLLIVLLRRTDLARLSIVLVQIRWEWYALAQLTLMTNLLLITWRWRYNLGFLQLRYAYRELFLIDNAGALAGAVTPGRMGDLARLIYFRQNRSVIFRIGLSILVERFLDLMVLGLLSLGFLWFFPLPVTLKSFLFNMVLVATLVVLGIIVIAWCSWGSDWLNTKILRILPQNLTDRFSGGAQELEAALRCYGTWRLVWSVTLTFLAWGCNILSAHLAAQSLTLPMTLWQTGACFCLSTFFTLIPVSIAGIGTRELAMVYLFSCLSLPTEQALAFSFLIFGFLLTHSLIGFLAILIKPPHTWQEEKPLSTSIL